MKKQILKFSMLTLALCAFTTMTAQEKPKMDKDAMFKVMDTNKDGVISADEFNPKEAKKALMEAKKEEKLKEHFAKMDKNGNNSISFEEFKEMAKMKREKAKERRHDREERKDRGRRPERRDKHRNDRK